MTLLVNGRDLTKSFGTEPLFTELRISVFEGDRLAVIGPNGAGKSTLLKILAAIETPDHGEVITRKGTRVVYIPQSRTFAADDTVLSVILDGARMASLPDAEAVANRVMGLAGFDEPQSSATLLSGGWRKRLLLAWGLAQEPDVLLLDEPSNHLDIHGILWLEGLLKQTTSTWVMISHDRMLIERTASTTAELSRLYPEGLFSVAGGFESFQQRKDAFLQAQHQYKQSLTNKVERETAWLRRGPKARTTKAQARVDSALRMTEELETVTQTLRTSDVQLEFASSGRKTKRLMELKGVSMAFASKVVIGDLNLLLTPGLRLGVLGDNGSGKSTLLKLLNGTHEPTEGAIRCPPDLRVVTFDQHREQLDPSWTLKHALSETGDAVVFRDRSVHLVSWAKRFRFEPDQLPLPLAQLSGGEQARVLIARLMLRPADVLLLDEPTNDLDIPTLDILEENLSDFPGALVLVSHDRYLMQSTCHRFLALDGRGGWQTYADYRQWERDLVKPESEPKPETPTKTKPESKNQGKLSYKHQREWDGMEARILQAETHLEACKTAAHDPTIASDADRLSVAFEDLAEAEHRVARLYERWSELESMQAR